MVDFTKRLGKVTTAKKINPLELYESLDRESDKGPLRSVQETILKNWFHNYYEEKDIMLKLHTGQGKTLIGLLMLQSRLNKGTGSAIYLLANRYLADYSCMQVDSFGINHYI